MRKIFKKVISAVASMTMLAGMVAGVPTIEAKAAPKDTELYVYLPDTVTGFDCVAFDLEENDSTKGNTFITSAASLTIDGWGGKQAYELTKVKDNLYKLNVNIEVGTGGLWGQVIVGTKSGSTITPTKGGAKLYLHDRPAIINSSDKIYFTIEPADYFPTQTWTAGLSDPTAAEKKYYVVGDKALTGYDWANGLDGSLSDSFVGVHSNELTGSGNVLTKTYSNVPTGTYKFKVIEGLSWVTSFPSGDSNVEMTLTEESDVIVKFDKLTNTASFTKRSVSSGEEQVEIIPEVTTTQATATTATTATPTQATTADPSFVAKDVKVKVKLDAAITWDKVYVYAWNADGNEDAWPGTEATKEGDYYVITVNAKTKYMNMIANNGSGEQTIDIENIDCSGDEVILNVSGEKNSDGKYVGTSPAQKTTTSGDTTPFVAIVAVLAMLGCAFVALNSKKARR